MRTVLKKYSLGLARVFVAVGLVAIAHAASAATVGPVTDPMGVIRIAKGAPIQIGAYWVLSGADTALGQDEKRGVEIAFKDVGGKVLGHPRMPFETPPLRVSRPVAACAPCRRTNSAGRP